ncbi:MAG: hypothetical protein DYG94_08865 [Leptolyngbya sp. PLA3]|nr:MAG: hypothetical protein EDM82_02930 [Cyanobacteria bacterium CYA]MCE7968841.1 hypothetical protein [Leptolyngbya sp. PL-A3]
MCMSPTLLSAAAALISLTSPPLPPQAPEPARQVRGRLINAQAQPVADALVLACDATSGLPLYGPKWLPFGSASDMQIAMASMRTAFTDAEGNFLFENAPDRPVKLVAQQWSKPPKPPKPLDVNGSIVRLVASPTVVDKDANEPVTLAPTGTAVLKVEAESANSESLVIVSTSPTIADPILGFSGWNGQFMRDALAWNRMPLGQTLFVGLPAGIVHITVFAADNNPGFGEALNIELREGHMTRVEIPWVASWSYGVHSPSPKIAEVRSAMENASLFSPVVWLKYLNDRNIVMPEPKPGSRMIIFPPDMLNTVVDLPGEAGKVRVGDSVAALAYENMRAQVTAPGRSLNPYREPVVTIKPLPENYTVD